MKKITSLLITLIVCGYSWGQTTLISSTGDGGFETGSSLAANNWNTANGGTNYWVVGTATKNGGTYSAYISNNGTSNSYSNSTGQTSHIYRDITFSSNNSSILTFDWKSNGESGYDRLLIYMAPTSVTPVAGTPSSNNTTLTGATLIGTCELQASWGSNTIDLGTTYAGGTYRLIFTWQNDNSAGTTPIAIDNISLIETPLLTGTKTIKTTGGDYASFTAAINALNTRGVGSGGVTFNVDAGFTITETCPAITTTTGSGSNPIVFQKSGSGANPTITAGTGTGTVDAIITLIGCDYVTFDGIDIIENASNNTDTKRMEYGYFIKNASATNGAQNNTIKNSKITLNRSNTSSTAIYQYTSTTPTNQGTGNNNNNKYYNITIENSAYGIYLKAYDGTYYDSGCEIGTTGGGTTIIGSTSANDIGNMGSSVYGIYLGYQNNYSVFNTEIRNVTNTGSSHSYGIYTYYCRGTSSIYNCKLHDISNTSTSSSYRSYGIYLDNQSTSLTTNIYNNFIYALYHGATSAQGSACIYGVYISSAGTTNLYYNSVRIDENQYPSTVVLYNYNTTLIVKNNILANFSTAGATSYRNCFYNYSGSITSDYNDLYIASGTGNFVGCWGSTDKTTLSDWKTDSGEGTHTISANPGFTSTSNLLINISDGNAANIDGKGTPISSPSITTDIEGTSRDGSTPDIGADEFSICSAPSITTTAVSSVAASSADFNGNITSNGGCTLTERGFCYKTSTGVAITDNKTAEGATATGAYSKSFSSLSVNTHYYYKAYAINSTGTTLSSTEIDFWTLANVPSAPTVANANTTTLDVTVNENGNPATTQFAIWCSSTSTWVQANGSLGASAVWQTDATWGTITVTGLTSNTSYSFQVKAKNGAGTETALSSAGTLSTTASAVPTITVGSVTAFSDQTVNTTSAEQSYSVSGTDLTSDITITPPAGFEISKTSGSGFVANPSTLTLTQSGGTVASTTISIRFKPTAITAYSGNITHVSSGATTKNVAVSGNGVAPTDPTGVSATTASTTQIDVAFTPNGGNNVLIAYNTTNSFGTPVNGTGYAAGNSLPTAGTVAYVGSTSAYNHTSLTTNQIYYYKVWTVDGSNFYSSGVSAVNATTKANVSATTTASTITTAGFSSGGTIDAGGGATLTARGIAIGTGSPATTLNAEGGIATGSFTKSVASLSAQTLYYYRAYATNAGGTSYGPEYSFRTLSTEPTAHPAAFTASAASSTQINLSFSAASTITNGYGYIILQRQGANPTGTPTDGTGYTVGNTIGDGTVAAIITSNATTSAAITSLTASTQYNYSIIAYSYDGTNAATYNYYTAATIKTANATTFCTNYTLPVTQGFNSSTIPSCWSQANISGSGSILLASFETSSSSPTTTPQEGANYVFWNSYSNSMSDGTSTRLISPAITTTGASSVDVEFYWFYDNYNTGYPGDGVYVDYSTDGSSWTAASSLIKREDVTLNGWTKVTVTLPAGAGNQANLYVAFRFVSGFGYNCSLDNVTIKVTPSTISAGTLTAFGNVCTNTTTAANSFTITGTNLTTADITVGALSGYTYSTTSGGTYTSSLTLTQPGGAYSQDIFVKFSPTAVQSYNGNIAVGGGGASSINVAATGSGINTIPTVTGGTAGSITSSSTTISGNTVTVLGCNSVSAYGVEYSISSGFANGAGTPVDGTGFSGSAGGTFSTALSGLTGNTIYYFHAYATNSGGTAYSSQGTFTTLKIEPTNQVTSFAVGAVTTSAIPLTWTAAVAGSQAPDGYLIKLNTSTVVDPVDGTDPANVTAVTGGAANKKVTPGSATSATSFTSMTAGTMYNFKNYSYTNSSTTIDFKTGTPPSINHATLPNPVTGGSVTATSATTANISWSAASGYDNTNHSTLVFVKATSAVTAGTPTNAPSTYTANTVFGSGTAYQGDASAKCVYKGDGTSVSITGLTGNTTYHILIYTIVDASNSNSTNSYSSGATANGTTAKIEPTNQVTSFAVGTVTTSNIPLTWTAAVAGSQAPDGYLIKLNTSSVVDPVDGTDPANVTAVTGGAANKKVTPGSATSATSFTSMTAGTMYNFKNYSYTNSSTTIDFKTGTPPAINHATLPNPVTGGSVTATSATTANISWSAASGYDNTNHSTLVFVKATSAVTAGSPTNAPSSYTANTVFGSGSNYQGDASAKCVYKGDGTSVSITGLTGNTTYHILIYTIVDASNSNSTNSYSSGATANGTTAKIEPTNQATSFAVGAVTTSNIPLTWTAAVAGSQAPDGYLIKLNTSSVVDPVDGTDPANVTAISSGAANYKSAGTSYSSFTGWTAGTMYNFKNYSYTNSSTNINFNITSVPSINHATLPNPVTAQSITATGATTADISWSSASGYDNTNHSTLVFVKATNAVTAGSPTNAPSTYTASTVFGSGSNYQGDASAKCVYKGDGTSVSITGLSPTTTYHILVYTVVDASNSNSTNSYSSGATANATTPCSPFTVPYTESFESGFTASADIAGCYSQQITSGSYYWTTINTTGDGHGGGNWYANLYTNNNTWLFIPVTLTADHIYSISLYAGSTSSSNSIMVKYGTTNTAAGMTSGTIINTTSASSSTYAQMSGAFSPSSTGTYYIGILGTITSYGNLWMDDISIVEIACAYPSTLTSSSITTTTATISWTAPPVVPSEGYQYYYSQSATAPVSGTTPSGSVAAGVVSANLTGLSPSATYYFWVRSKCNSSDVSDWVGSATFAPSCGAATIPFFEGFETGFTDNTNVGGCYTQEDISGIYQWKANNGSAGGSPYAGTWNASLYHDNSDWLFFRVALTAGAHYRFSIFAESANSANITVKYGTTGSQAGMTSGTIMSSTAISDTYTEYVSSSFTPSSTATYYIGIYAEFPNSGLFLSIDNISIVQLPDSTSKAEVPTSQVATTTISSINNDTPAEALNVFDFKITDMGSTDGIATKVTNIRIKPGSNNTADWTNNIQGVKLYDGATPITIGTPTITDTYIDIPITSGNLDIANNTSKTISLYTYLNTSNITDGAVLDFKIGYSSHGFTAHSSGSQFATTFGGADIEGNNITIAVVSTKLTFASGAPGSGVPLNTAFTVTANATDANGNTDLDVNSGTITLSKTTGSGTLSSASGLSKSIVNGATSWTNMMYDASENCAPNGLSITATHSGALTSATTGCIQVMGAPGTFTISSTATGGCGGTMTLTWNASSDATSYDIYYCTTASCDPTSGTLISNQVSPYSFSTSAGTLYRIKILAKNVASQTWSTNVYEYNTWSGATWKGSSNTTWSNGANWCGGSAPTYTEDIVINAGVTYLPVLTADASVNSFTLASGSSLGLGSYTLNMYGSLDASTGTLTSGTGTLNFASNSYNMSATTTYVESGDLLYDSGGPSGDYSYDENITHVYMPKVAGEMVSITLTDFYSESDGDYLTIYDNDSASGTKLLDAYAYSGLPTTTTFTATNSTGALTFVFESNGSINYDGWSAIVTAPVATETINMGTNTINNLTINGPTISVTNNKLDINGNLTINSGTLKANDQNIEIAGNWTNYANFDRGTGEVVFDGSGNSTITKRGPIVTVYSTGFEDSDGGTAGWNLGSTAGHTEWRRLDQAGAGNAPRGTWDCGAFDLVNSKKHAYYYSTDRNNNTYNDLSRMIDLTDVDSAKVSYWYYYKGGQFSNEYAGFLMMNGIAILNDNYAVDIYTQVSNVDITPYCNQESIITFRNNLIYQGDAPTDAGNYGFSVDDIIITGKSNAEIFNKLTINKSGGGIVYLNNTQNTKFNVFGDINIASGTLNAQGNRIRCKGDFIVNGSFVAGTGSEVLMYGLSEQKIRGSQDITFYKLSKNSTADLIIGDNATSGKTIEVTNAFSWVDNNDKLKIGNGQAVTFKMAGDLLINNGCTLETSDASTVSIAGNYTDFGTYTPNNGMIKFHGSTNSYIIRHPSQIIYQEGFENHTAPGWTLGGASNATWEIHQGAAHNSTYDLAIRDYTINVPYDYLWNPAEGGYSDASVVVNLTGYTNVELQFYYRIGGEAINDVGQVFVNGNLVLDNLYGKPYYTLSPTVDISQYANQSDTITFRFKYNSITGNAPGFCIDDIVLTGTSINLERFYDISVDKTGGKSAVLRCPIDVDNNVTITNGDLNSGGMDFPVGGNWSNLNSSTFTHQSNTVTFDGNGESKSQTITNNSVNKFFNVNINNTGGTLALATNRWYLENNLTITAGTLNATSQDIHLHGNWMNNGGTFNPASQTVFFRGADDQHLKSNGSLFYNITLPSIAPTKGNRVVLNDALTLNNNLTLSSGFLDVNDQYNIEIKGNWYNDGGGFTHPNNSTTEVKFSGTSTQNVNLKADNSANTNNFSFDNVTIDGSDVRFNVVSDSHLLLIRNMIINNGKTFKLIKQ